MSTGAQRVYRSTHPDVVAAWHAANDAFLGWKVKVEAFMADHPGHTALVRGNGGNHGQRLVGMTQDRDKPLPDGWRWHRQGRDTHGIVPDRRTKIGKATAAAMEEAAFRVDGFPGMPDLHVSNTDGHWYHPGFENIDGAVYARWACEEAPGDGWTKTPLDLDLWDLIKLSEYHAAAEAKAAA